MVHQPSTPTQAARSCSYDGQHPMALRTPGGRLKCGHEGWLCDRCLEDDRAFRHERLMTVLRDICGELQMRGGR